jgi:hypothetical protein
MVKFDKHRAGAAAAFVLALGQSVVATPSFAQRSAHRYAASARYLLLAVICQAAPVLTELLMAPCASPIFSGCLAALLRLVAAPNPVARIAKPPDVRARRLAHPPKDHVAMCKIEQIHSGSACAAPADIMERAIEQTSARVSDASPSNQIDGRTSCSRYVSDPRYSSPALTAMPVPQPGWCRILLRG